MSELLSILLLEEDRDRLSLLTKSLQRLHSQGIDIKLKVALSLEKGIEALNHSDFDLVIATLYLPDSQGMDTLLEIQRRAGSAPIILIGPIPSEEIVREAIRLGAQDYLPYPELESALLSRMLHHAIERHHLQESLKALSFTDELTGVYNRRGFMTLLTQQMAFAKRIKQGFYLFLIDLDYLKHINDTYGHLIGDQALIHTAHCLRSSFRHYDIIGRIGGDEFAIIAINTPIESGPKFKNQMIDQLNTYNLGLHAPYQLSFSIGSAYYSGTAADTLDQLLQKADSELYEQKRHSHRSEK